MPEADATPGTGTSAARASVTAVVGVLGAVALLLLLVTWAATIGPQEVVTDPGNPPTNLSVPTTTATSAPDQGGHTAPPPGKGDRDVLFTVVTIVATLLATIVMLAVLLTALRWLLTRDWRRRREPEPDEVEFDPLDSPALLAEALVAGAPAQRAALEEGDPRNAIVECWHRFERLAERTGVRRRPWETSSEFTLRLLDRVSADSAAVATLAELYRDARYSAHDVTEDNRARAVEALDVIHLSVGRVSTP
jgi:uncharacterized protein DUF4129